MLKHLAIAAVIAAAAIAPALAQIAPNDTGRGVQRGLTAVNSSAQTGMVTVLRGGGSPRIQITVDGSAGHPESVTLVRGRTCPEALHASNVAVLGTAARRPPDGNLADPLRPADVGELHGARPQQHAGLAPGHLRPHLPQLTESRGA